MPRQPTRRTLVFTTPPTQAEMSVGAYLRLNAYARECEREIAQLKRQLRQARLQIGRAVITAEEHRDAMMVILAEEVSDDETASE